MPKSLGRRDCLDYTNHVQIVVGVAAAAGDVPSATAFKDVFGACNFRDVRTLGAVVRSTVAVAQFHRCRRASEGGGVGHSDAPGIGAAGGDVGAAGGNRRVEDQIGKDVGGGGAGSGGDVVFVVAGSLPSEARAMRSVP